MRLGTPLVVGSCLGGNFVGLLGVSGLFILQVVVALELSLDAERVLFEGNKREVELLLDAEALEQLQITLSQCIHDLLAALLAATFILESLSICHLDEVDAVELILVAAGDGLVNLNLREVEELLIPERVVHDCDVLYD